MTALRSVSALEEPRPVRWTRDEYYRLYEQGMFEGRRVELIEGEIVEMPAQKDAHAWTISAVERQLRPIAEPGNWIRMQMPLALSLWSDPEPDLAIVAGDYPSWKGKGHPATALLVIEVSDTTLLFDRRIKASLYAAASVPEFWIVNLVDHQLEVHREPLPNAENPRASRYLRVTKLDVQSQLNPLAFPQAMIQVADLLT